MLKCFPRNRVDFVTFPRKTNASQMSNVMGMRSEIYVVIPDLNCVSKFVILHHKFPMKFAIIIINRMCSIGSLSRQPTHIMNSTLLIG